MTLVELDDAGTTTLLAMVDDVPPQGRGALRCTAGDTPIGLFRLGEEIVAWRDVCPHEAAPVCRGQIAGTRLTSEVSEYTYGRHEEVLRCPWHGWEFDLATGRHLAEGSGARLRRHPIEVRDGAIYDASGRGLLHARDLVVEHSEPVGDVVVLDLVAADRGPLPAWTAGAHVELRLPSGLIRQYSLCGDDRDRQRYRIAVLRQPAGRGGSQEVHRLASPGTRLAMRAIRNRFPLRYARHYVFLAAGVGITPIVSMLRQVERRGASYRAYYVGRRRDGMAFADEVAMLQGGAVIETATHGRPDLSRVLGTCATGTEIYCCGPAGFVEDVVAAAGSIPVHAEVFTSTTPPPADATPLTVTAARTGRTIEVAADESILHAVRREGIQHDSSCEDGWCGSCETRVLHGRPIHHDSVLEDFERESNESMMICVSRAVGDLVLDL